MTDHEQQDQEVQIELTGCRDALREVQDVLNRLNADGASPELAEAANKVTEALDALRRHGHDGIWSR
jgi:hypothetical protein